MTRPDGGRLARAALLLAAGLGLSACEPPSLGLTAESSPGHTEVHPSIAFEGPLTVVLQP